MDRSTAIQTVIRIVKAAIASDNKLGYLIANIVELIDSVKVIIDFILDQMRDEKVMATTNAFEWMELERVLVECVDDADARPEGPLTWLALMRLMLKLLEMLKKG